MAWEKKLGWPANMLHQGTVYPSPFFTFSTYFGEQYTYPSDWSFRAAMYFFFDCVIAPLPFHCGVLMPFV
jgi:hypothetical protein